MNLPCVTTTLWVGTFITFASCFNQFDPELDTFAEEISRYIDVTCTKMNLTVSVNFNETHPVLAEAMLDRFKKASVCMNGPDEECCADMVLNKKKISLTVDWKMCGMRTFRTSYAMNHTGGMHFVKDDGTATSFNISCAILLERPGNELKAKMELLRNDKEIPVTYHENKTFYILPMNAQVQSKVTISSPELPEFIQTYPMSCHSRPVQMPQPVKYFINDGCPVFLYGLQPLSSLFQENSYGRFGSGPEVYVNIVPSLVTTPFNHEHEKFYPLLFECTVFVCNTHRRHAVYGVPNCPSAAPCDGDPYGRQPKTLWENAPILTAGLESAIFVSSAIDWTTRPLGGAFHKDSLILGFGTDKTAAQVSENTPGEQYSKTNCALTPTAALVLLAFTGFLFGIFFAGIVWFIYAKTGAIRKVFLSESDTAPEATADQNCVVFRAANTLPSEQMRLVRSQ